MKEVSAPSPWLRPELVASWREIALVLAVVVGPFAGRSTWAAWHGSASSYLTLILSDSRLLSTAAIESVLLALFFVFLQWRGWKISDFKIRPGWRSTLQGALLYFPAQIGNAATVLGLFFLIFALQHIHSHFANFLIANAPPLKSQGIEVGWGVALGSLVLNAFFEELTCTGYAFNQLAAKRGPLFALLLVVLMRMACHTYQGPVHVVGIGVLFLIYGLWYWYTRNLWTLIFAHAVLDLASVAVLKAVAGH